MISYPELRAKETLQWEVETRKKFFPDNPQVPEVRDPVMRHFLWALNWLRRNADSLKYQQGIELQNRKLKEQNAKLRKELEKFRASIAEGKS